MDNLRGKHIIVGVCGGIAAYKTAVLVRLLVKAGAEVQVVMTPSAREFITPLTLSTLSGKGVISEFFTANTGEWHSHVDLGLWADAMVIAPATACTLGKMAHGVADNMLVTTYLSAKCPVFVAPAMDLDMMVHPSTKANLALLTSYGNHIIEAERGELASHLTGKGRMAEPQTIVSVVDKFFAKSNALSGKKILITAGPTYERIDPVRFIGNFSSGKMGYALAAEAASRGAEVTVISGPVGLTQCDAFKVISVESAQEMLEAALAEFDRCDVGIMCAAVADYRPKECATQKIKRENAENMTIELVRNPDIAASLGCRKLEGQILIGFALESDFAAAHAAAKLARKHLDAIVVNSINDSSAPFGSDSNEVTILRPDGSSTFIPRKSKREIASDILDIIPTL